MSGNKKVSFGRIALDVFLTCITGGLWLIVILIKYLRKNS